MKSRTKRGPGQKKPTKVEIAARKRIQDEAYMRFIEKHNDDVDRLSRDLDMLTTEGTRSLLQRLHEAGLLDGILNHDH
jgi:hypothetical protein